MQKAIHILRYGTVAEKAHLEKAINTYDYLGINGNTAAYVSKAIAKFVVEKFFHSTEKGFFIDPITYAFQNNIHLLYNKPKKKSDIPVIKKSIVKLIEYYGDSVAKVAHGKPVIPSDFSDISKVELFCQRVLDFQYSVINQYIKEKDLEKYLLYAAKIESLDTANQLRPKFLIAPYFYLNSDDKEFQAWLEINLSFIHAALQYSAQSCHLLPVFSQIVVSKATLTNQVALKAIIEAYKSTNCNGYTIWIDDLKEHEAAFDVLQGLKTLLIGLKGKPIYNMYGSYFSILMTHKSVNLLQGVSHGMEYGESRAVYPVGGGIPVSKYYYMPLHQRTDFTKAFYLLEQQGIINTSLPDWGDCKRYYKEICGCQQCRTIMQNEMINFVNFESDQFYEYTRNNQVMRRKKASSETKENCLYHYLLCKRMEFDQVNRKKLSLLLSALSTEKEKYKDGAFLSENELAYLDIWNSILSSYCEE
jgi:hypothetical protein